MKRWAKIYKDQMIASRIEYSNLKPPAGREESSDPSFIYDPEQDLG